MKFIENLIFLLFPQLLLKKKAWAEEYHRQEKEAFLKGARIFFALAAFLYVLHYYTVDRGEGLAPSPLWFTYRYSMAAIALVCLICYSFKRGIVSSRRYKWPTILACATFCFFQARTVLWYAAVPYVYSFLFVLISVFILRMPLASSLGFAIAVMGAFLPSLIEAGVSISMAFSAFSVTLIFIIYGQSRTLFNVQLFIANQQNLETQKKVIEINLEFNNQLRSFLPREIYERIIFNMRKKRMAANHAIEEVLRPRKRDVACLFSDIRGYTKSSKSNDSYILSSVLPNIKECTEAIEALRGIPRKIGDLIFSYFDHESQDINICRALLAAHHVCIINNDMNLISNIEVHRSVIITSGEATVGNVGGASSAFEITALGSPANLAARIDEAIKHTAMRTLLASTKIICDEQTALACFRFAALEHQLVPLDELGITIRDFSEVTKLYLIKPTRANSEALSNALEALRQEKQTLFRLTGSSDHPDDPYKDVYKNSTLAKKASSSDDVPGDAA